MLHTTLYVIIITHKLNLKPTMMYQPYTHLLGQIIKM